MTVAVASPDQLIDKLKQDWDQLSDTDRALKVAQIKKSSDLSKRKIASRLGCAENTVRRLLYILRAPAADFAAARDGMISTNELIRRTEAALHQQASQRKAQTQREKNQLAIEGANLISGWLEKHNRTGAYGEQIVDEARRIMIDAFYAGILPHVDPPSPAVPSDVIIERCKPKEPLTDDINSSGWYSKWLARWIVFVFLDTDVRDKALELALKQQQKR